MNTITDVPLGKVHVAMRLDKLESYLRDALETLRVTHGKAAVDNRALGASTMLVERSLATVKLLRDDLHREEMGDEPLGQEVPA